MDSVSIARHQVMARNGLAINIMLFVLLKDSGFMVFGPVTAVVFAYLSDFLYGAAPRLSLLSGIASIAVTVLAVGAALIQTAGV